MKGIETPLIQAKDLTTDKVKTRPRAENPVKICDTTFRDGHQSTLATRMRTSDMEWMAEEMNKCGFYCMEVWGGATFDVPHRFLGEDPWERPRTLKRLLPDTPLAMLLRGQNLVAYRNHPDDLVDAFVEQAVEVGIDIFRVFDAVNDERNHERAAKAIKKYGKIYRAEICYSLTQPRMGGPVYNLEYYVRKALIFQNDLDADIICIKDQAGLISPYDAYDLVKALKQELRVPVELHTHYTSGQGSMSLLKAVEAGVDIVDTALSPFALRSSQPAIEPLVVALYGTDRDTGLDIEQLFRCGEMLEQIAPKYRDFLDTSRMSVIDVGVLVHQIPGGMTTNLVSQLKQADALDRLGECQDMTAKVRAELGYPPLVTPTSQIVGVQAVQNVLVGPYKMISKEVKDYCWGLYGKSPAPIDKDIQRMILKGYERGETPITGRAADMLEPELEEAKAESRGFARTIQDVLLYALYRTTGARFLKHKYGIDKTIPDDWKPPRAPKTMEEVKREDELIARARAGKLVEKVEKPVPQKGPGLRTFNVFVEDEYYQVEVEAVNESRVQSRESRVTGRRTPVDGQDARPTQIPYTSRESRVESPESRGGGLQTPGPRLQTPDSRLQSRVAPAPTVAEGEKVVAPVFGMIIRYEVEVGDQVKVGDPVVILESMKMENTIPAPVDGTVAAINFEIGANVGRNDVLAVIN